MIALFLLANAVAGDIVVTASLTPREADAVPASVTRFDAAEIDELGFPDVADIARLVPGVSVASAGGRGAQTQLRIRGAEANHSLLFVDGIALNDPAAGNEARFETLLSDTLDRIEIVRGPQSALWGSEAIGGVVALDSVVEGDAQASGSVEAGSGLTRASLRASAGGLTVTATGLRDRGIDILGGGTGDRDGVREGTIGLKAVLPVGPGEFGVAGRIFRTDAEFDGTDPATFRRADTDDRTHSTLAALRGWATVAGMRIDGQYLSSMARDYDGVTALARRRGDRFRAGAQAEANRGPHQLVLRVEREEETFATSDEQYGGLTEQRRTRARSTAVGELSSQWSDRLRTDVALRRDAFNRFADATTLRAGLVWGATDRVRIHASYGEGIAQPTFYDLYGFFPGSFVGNPALKAERARSGEIGASWRSSRFEASVTGFTGTLRDEIVPVYDTLTFLSSTANADGTSRRRGIELAASWRPGGGVRLDANYSLLDAREPASGNGRPVKETRRPRHSANLIGSWTSDAASATATLAYVGARTDIDFDAVPAVRVRLRDYVLASARVERRVARALRVFVRAENLLDAHYQDVVGYRTPGRAVYGGVRVEFDR